MKMKTLSVRCRKRLGHVLVVEQYNTIEWVKPMQFKLATAIVTNHVFELDHYDCQLPAGFSMIKFHLEGNKIVFILAMYSLFD